MFGFSKNKKLKQSISLVDCKNGNIFQLGNAPVKLGGNDDSNNNLYNTVNPFLEILQSGDSLTLNVLSDELKIKVNSAKITDSIEISNSATLQLNDNLYYLIADPQTLERAKKMDVSKWIVFHSETGRIEDEVPFARLKQAMISRGLNGVGIAICPKGFELGFLFSSVFDEQNAITDEQIVVPMLAESTEALTCPLCWLKFDIGDAMSIAVHESLRSDPILGVEEMLRFLPTSFNDDGVPLDPAGMPSPDVACPHCRKKLPPNYLELESKIFSIVGAPSAGKSYYLSALIRELQGSLYKNFNIVLKDLDPSGNMLLTQMKNSLFSAKNPEDAILAKTALEGLMYERYPRFGKMVALPKPMTYALSKDDKDATSIIFYDNAGEHFEPGLDIEESPGAMHVASSAGIFFLFDPAANRNFKKAIGNHPDPQLSIDGRLDQQDIIVSEMEVRIKRILALETSKKIDTPTAIMIGKCDIWQHLLPKKLENPIVDGKLDTSIVDANSNTIKKLLLDIDPVFTANALSISTNVKFFAISALGHSPTMLTEGKCAGKIAPIPSKVDPIDVEIPTIWVLSQTTDIIPTK